MGAIQFYKKRSVYIIAVIALVLSLIAELTVISGSVAVCSERSASLLHSDSVTWTAHQYNVDGMHFKKTAADPQLMFSNVNQTFEYIAVSFAAPIFEKTYIQVYYRESGNGFSEECSTGQIRIPFASSHMVLQIPKAQYEQIRVDIDGDFELSDVVVSHDRIRIAREWTGPFRFSRWLIVCIGIVAAEILLLWWIKKPRTKTKLSVPELLFCAGCFLFYTLWAIEKPISYAPDEFMRFEVTQFLFEHGRLPIGEELISQPWGFSYAHFPIVLCNQLGYLAMKVASLFMSGSFKMLVAARMVSVCAGTGIVYYTIKTSKLLFRSPARYVMIAFVAFMPQFAFLSSYVNNDSLALLGVAMILYAWVSAIEFTWNWKSALLLAVGVAVCGLAYYNSYSWILMSIVFFVVSYYYQNRRDHKGFSKMLLFIVGIVVLLIAYNFIRHVVLYGDLLGFKTRRYYGELYGIDALKPSVTQSLRESGIPFADMLFEKPYDFIQDTWKSFVGVFGYMSVFCPESVYDVMLVVVRVALIGLALKVAMKIAKKRRPQPMQVLLVVCMIISSLISIGLAVYNSYTGDFQAQGRYCYPAFLAVAFFVAKGFETFITFWKRREQQYAFTAILCTAFAALSYYVYAFVFLPS